jgi:type IV secretory pathway VirJ component
VVAELKKISPSVPVLIITGSDENSPLPTKLSGTTVQFAQVPGDHHYNNDSFAIFNTLREKSIIK